MAVGLLSLVSALGCTGPECEWIEVTTADGTERSFAGGGRHETATYEMSDDTVRIKTTRKANEAGGSPEKVTEAILYGVTTLYCHEVEAEVEVEVERKGILRRIDDWIPNRAPGKY